MTIGKLNLEDKLTDVNDFWSPAIVGYMNELKVQVLKAKGKFVWHSHPDTDELFLVIRGSLTIQMREREVRLGEGDLFVVPKGVEHRPMADEEAHILLVDPVGTPNTGDAGSDLTAREREI